MKSLRFKFPVEAMCRVLEVSRSGYYASLTRAPSQRARDDERLKVAIRVAHRRTRESYGARRLQPELAAEGLVVGRDRIARPRAQLGLAPMESFWGSLKNELVHHRRYQTRSEAEASIREYIEIFYNRQRRHSRLGYLAPAVFEQGYWEQQRAA